MRISTRILRLLALTVMSLSAHFLDAAGPTNVSGIMTQSTTWTASNSPYVVTGNVLVSAGVTLTIEPGTQIQFQAGTFLQVNGVLIADGSQSSNIVFTSAASSPAAGDWGPISSLPR